MKKGLIAINKYFKNAALFNQCEALRRAFAARGVEINAVPTADLGLRIEGESVRADLPPCDFCIFLDKDVNAALMLEKCGVKLFNGAEAIRLCDDKMLTFIALSGAGIRMPETVPAPLMYAENDDAAFLDKTAARLGFPVVVKKAYGSMGAGVFLAENREKMGEYFERFRLFPHLYQKFIGRGGEDLRIVTVGGKVAAAMRRVNRGDFRSNIERGGTGERVLPTAAQIFIAERASGILKLDYAGVDILSDETGDYLCEVNSNAFFGGIARAAEIDVADAYAEEIYGKIYRGM